MVNATRYKNITPPPRHPPAFKYFFRYNDSDVGCGSVGGAVTSNTRYLRFESSQRQTLYFLNTVNCIETTKIKKKGRECPILTILTEQFIVGSIRLGRQVPTINKTFNSTDLKRCRVLISCRNKFSDMIEKLDRFMNPVYFVVAFEPLYLIASKNTFD